MKKRHFFGLLLCVLTAASALAVNGDMGGGNGSESTPYLIEDLADFDTFADPNYAATYWAAGVHTQLMTDIDLSGHSLTPIGNFYGVFDGNLHDISNATINLPGSNNVGLFSYAWGGSEIKDLNFTDANIIGNNGVGILVGINFDGTISNCNTTGTVEGNKSVGGLVGSNSYGTIENSSADISVTGTEDIGGLVGTNFDTINNCFAKGTVLASGRNIGGLVGIHYENEINDSHAICTVTGVDSVGGLCGWTSGNILGSYSTGKVVGGFGVGGLIGYAHYTYSYNTCNILDSWSSADVSGNTHIGGIVGFGEGIIIKQCYFTGQVRAIEGIFEGENAGGIFGRIWSETLNSTVRSCYSTGFVTGTCNVGGIGGLSNCTISDCYSTGDVTAMTDIGSFCSSGAGGIVGTSCHTVSRCYATGTITCNNGDASGLVSAMGSHACGGVINDCFWDTETSGTNDGIGDIDPDPAGAVGTTTAEMMTESTFTDWDFSNTDGDPADWMMLREGEDYPRLAWQEVFDGDIAGLYGVDLVDFAYLANYWQLTGCNSGTDCGRADIDGSGDVGLADLVYVSEDWLKE